MRPRPVALTLLAIAAVAFAGGSSAATSALSKPQLAIVVVPKASLGPAAAALDVTLGSGYADNAEAADDTLDPEDTGPQIGRAGRVTGYSLGYGDLSNKAFARGSGLLEIDTDIDSFTSARTADAFLTKQLRDAMRFRGKQVEFGIRLTSASTFPVAGLGDRAIGIRVGIAFGDSRAYSTTVAFRVGSLLAEASISRADAKQVNASVERIARTFAQRIRLAAAGRLNAKPVAVPQTARKGRAPAGGPNLAGMALSAADLAAGVKVGQQGYADDDSSIALYEREFDTSAARFGQSSLISVRNRVSLLRTADEAAGVFVILRALYESDDFAQGLAREVAKGAGTKVTSVRLESRKRLTIGDEGRSVVIGFQAGAVTFHLALIDLRVERVVGSLIVFGTGPSFRLADVEPIAGKLAKKIEAGL